MDTIRNLFSVLPVVACLACHQSNKQRNNQSITLPRLLQIQKHQILKNTVSVNYTFPIKRFRKEDSRVSIKMIHIIIVSNLPQHVPK